MAGAGATVLTRDKKTDYVKFVFVTVASVATAVFGRLVGREKLVAVTVTVTDWCCSSKGMT